MIRKIHREYKLLALTTTITIITAITTTITTTTTISTTTVGPYGATVM